MKKKAIIFVLCIVFALSVFLTGSANKTDTYVLYKNDTKFDFAEYPALNLDGELHVPSSCFIGFKDILYEYSEKYQSFYFMNTDTGRYFAFSFNAPTIILDGEFIQKNFPILNSTIYMPLEYCADILSLNIETYKENNVEHIRLYDEKKSLEFIELIELFDPAGRLDPPTPPDLPPVTDDPIEPENPIVTPSEKTTVYLMIRLSDPSYSSRAIDLLYAFGERATVFFDKDTLTEFPEEVVHATAGGNSVGIFSNSEDTTLDETNKVLEHITNYATRICLSDDTSHESDGYNVRNATVDCSKYSSLKSWEAAEKIYNDAMQFENPHILIDAVKSNENLLMTLLGMFANDSFVELEAIHPSLP